LRFIGHLAALASRSSMPNLLPPTADDFPQYSPQQLEGASTQQLLEWLGECAEFAPRNLFEAAAARGEEMVACLEPYGARVPQILSEDLEEDEVWVLVHGVNLLGRIDSLAAGELLVRLLSELIECDQDMFDWIAQDWPYLFANKPDAVQAVLDRAMRDRDRDGLLREAFARCLVAMAADRGEPALDAMIDHVAAQLHGADDIPDFRWFAASTLLDFPRARHRALLSQIAREQHGAMLAVFHESDVAAAFRRGSDVRSWLQRDPPWAWYDEERVLARLQRWFADDELDEDASESSDDFDDYDYDDDSLPELPHVREAPKVGRNDPCPCGSGKKYKKCCLPKEQ
jgi:hypothetical protein